MLKITDLVDSRDVVDLHESEMKSIRGGDCDYGNQDYEPGEEAYFGGQWNKCTDIPWYKGGDDWLPA